jgi:hypothetical protein
MTPLNEYGELIDEVERVIGSLSHLPTASIGCSPGCAECCIPPTLLPLEASVIKDAGAAPRSPEGHSDRCPMLTADRLCAIYPARPLVCRVRGFPVDCVDEDGMPVRENCAKNRFPMDLGEFGAMRLEEWNARLYRISARFCAQEGIPLRRMRILDAYEIPKGLSVFRFSVNLA